MIIDNSDTHFTETDYDSAETGCHIGFLSPFINDVGRVVGTFILIDVQCE